MSGIDPDMFPSTIDTMKGKAVSGMDQQQILDTIKALGTSKGSYARLAESITDDALDYLAAQDFSDPVDLIMFLEG